MQNNIKLLNFENGELNESSPVELTVKNKILNKQNTINIRKLFFNDFIISLDFWLTTIYSATSRIKSKQSVLLQLIEDHKANVAKTVKRSKQKKKSYGVESNQKDLKESRRK